MKPIFKHTFLRMFKRVPIILSVLVSLIAGWFMAKDYNKVILRQPSFDYINERMIVLFCVISFVMITGIVLCIIVANTSSGLFANEIHEGTLRLLVAKPIKRSSLVLGKILGTILGGVVYSVSSLIIVLAITCLFTSIDQNIVLNLIKYAIAISLYGAFLTAFVGSVGSFLSTCFKKKVPALLILVGVGFFAYAIFPIMRLFLTQKYPSLNLSYIDINFHLGIIFNQFIELVGGLQGTTNQIDLFNFFTGLFKTVSIDSDITLNDAGSLYTLNQSINHIVVLVSYSLISVGLYALTFKQMAKKDI
ncbi:MAG: ABC transporter permease subunit [Erysipelotrichaceae bacterium]|nr:ABC transporter permease subunit [Erysipelotrichaceae bacterium]